MPIKGYGNNIDEVMPWIYAYVVKIPPNYSVFTFIGILKGKARC